MPDDTDENESPFPPELRAAMYQLMGQEPPEVKAAKESAQLELESLYQKLRTALTAMLDNPADPLHPMREQDFIQALAKFRKFCTTIPEKFFRGLPVSLLPVMARHMAAAVESLSGFLLKLNDGCPCPKCKAKRKEERP